MFHTNFQLVFSLFPVRLHLLKRAGNHHPPLRQQATAMPSRENGNGDTSSKAATAAGAKRKPSISPPPTKKARTSATANARHLDYSHVPSGWLDVPNKQNAQQESLQLTYHKGDMFADVPRGTVLVHACNTQGHWGAGIAKAFKQHYPKAYADHNKFCTKDHSKSNPVATGTAQLLAPRDGEKQHWIGCVFTSAKYGKGKDKPDQIIKNTAKSLPMLFELISQVDDEISGIRMCKINSGKFGVSWEKTEEILESIEMKPHWRTKVEIWEPDVE